MAANNDQLIEELGSRSEEAKAQTELRVNYYRIHQRLAFELPVTDRPKRLPEGIPGFHRYPWMVWLCWALMERWRVLMGAGHWLDDHAAEQLVQAELGALAGWDAFKDSDRDYQLSTAHLAQVMAEAVPTAETWPNETRHAVNRAANRLIDRDVMPWFEWRIEGVEPMPLHNIPAMSLLAASWLARTLNHEAAARFDVEAERWLAFWAQARIHHYHCEGPAYDGFLADVLTGWIQTHPNRQQILTRYRPAFESLLDQWVALAIPGQPERMCPLGDVEPQMRFWMIPLTRLGRWLEHVPARRLLERIPLAYRTTPVILDQLANPWPEPAPSAQPSPALSHSPQIQITSAAATIRTAGASGQMLLAASLPRCSMTHLHPDAGSIVLAWRGRCWVSDPGYQQYRQGPQRAFTLGTESHNAPVINGQPQSKRAGQLLAKYNQPDQAIVDLDLTEGYEHLPSSAGVRRRIRGLSPASPGGMFEVIDQLTDLAEPLSVETYWQIDGDLAVAFVDGWVRLSDATAALWLGLEEASIQPPAMKWHEGSHGPMTLHVHWGSVQNKGTRRWKLILDESGGWEVPTFQLPAD